MNQKKYHRTLIKLFALAGIAATIGISVAIHAASLSTISTPTTLKTLTPTTPTTTTTKTPISTVPSTTPLKIIAPVAPTTLTPTQTKTITPTLTTPTPTTSPSPTTTKEPAPQTEPTMILPITDTKTTTPVRRLTSPSPNPLTITPSTPTTPIEKTTSPGALEIPVKLIAPIEKIAPLPPQTPSIILPLKDVTKDTPTSPTTAPTEFLITTPTKNTDAIPLTPVAPEKTEESTILIKRRPIPATDSGSRTRTIDLPVKQPETPAELPFTETTLTETSLVSDVSESNRAYSAIVEMLDLMKEKGNYALPKSKKFRPKNKVGWAFGAQLALTISGESCGEMRGRNKRTVCVAKAMTIGLIDKNTIWNKPMTKGEFYELILNALKIPAVEPAGDTICVDVDATHKFANVIATAKYYGITKRYSYKGEGGYCLPDTPLTKADAAVIASKALEAKKNLQQ